MRRMATCHPELPAHGHGLCHHCYSRWWQEEKGRAYDLQRRYGLTLEDYARMSQQQDGKCAICGEPERRRDQKGRVKLLAVDHDHTCCPGRKACSKCIRGLLCDRCNTLIGEFNENVELLRKVLPKAITYLKGGSTVASGLAA